MRQCFPQSNKLNMLPPGCPLGSRQQLELLNPEVETLLDGIHTVTVYRGPLLSFHGDLTLVHRMLILSKNGIWAPFMTHFSKGHSRAFHELCFVYRYLTVLHKNTYLICLHSKDKVHALNSNNIRYIFSLYSIKTEAYVGLCVERGEMKVTIRTEYLVVIFQLTITPSVCLSCLC